MTSTIHISTSPYRTFTTPLESCDVLGFDEYWRRYGATPEKLKAERINPKVYIMSPLRAVDRGNHQALLCDWLGNYAKDDPGLVYSDNGVIRMDTASDPQTDLCVLCNKQQTHLNADALRAANALKLTENLQRRMESV
jgi:hypothetical protein